MKIVNICGGDDTYVIAKGKHSVSQQMDMRDLKFELCSCKLELWVHFEGVGVQYTDVWRKYVKNVTILMDKLKLHTEIPPEIAFFKKMTSWRGGKF